MNRGGKSALLISCLALGGCASNNGIEVRAIADPAAAISRGGDAIAVARGQLMLGNAGLALEAFRKAQRENPSDAAALAGIGDCYAAMGRFDLAQSNYEAALALSPHDQKLLLGIASIFEHEGQPARALIARAEAASAQAETTAVPRAAANITKAAAVPTVRPAIPEGQPVAKSVPVVGSITVELPKAKPVEHFAARPIAPAMAPPAPAVNEIAELSAAVPSAQFERVVVMPAPAIGSVTIELPKARPAAHVEVRAVAPAMSQLRPAEAEPIRISTAAPSASSEPAARIPSPALGSAAVELSHTKVADRLKADATPPSMTKLEEYQPKSDMRAPPRTPRPGPEPSLPLRADANAVLAEAVSPRLERLSRGEVALITTGKPIWRAAMNERTASAKSVRWIALASGGRSVNVQILNAARTQGLAASARTVLLNRGWRSIAVGDATVVQHKSVVLYPKDRARIGRSLAAQFGVSARMVERDGVVLILGRDAVDVIAGPKRS